MSSAKRDAADVGENVIRDYQRHRKEFRAYQALGDKVWFYTCCFPGGPWLNRLLDQELLRPVLMANPVSPFLEATRSAILHAHGPSWMEFGLMAFWIAVTAIGGAWVFARYAPRFAEDASKGRSCHAGTGSPRSNQGVMRCQWWEPDTRVQAAAAAVMASG